MLTLSILRHAKSSWGDPTLKDIDRPLNGRGKSQTERLGHYLSQLKIAPDLIICSTAKRARQTLERARKNWQTEAELILESRLYLAAPHTIKMLLAEHGQEAEHIMIVGHNPGFHSLAYELADTGPKNDLSLLEEKYPTGTLSVINSNASSWKKIGNSTGKLIYLATPKQLAAQ